MFAHTDPDAWSTLIEGQLSAGLVPVGVLAIDTEMESRTAGAAQARLSTSVWMACRKRDEAAPEAFLGDVLDEMRPVIRERLLSFWAQGIRGADFFISAIGPALSRLWTAPTGAQSRRLRGFGTRLPRHRTARVDRRRAGTDSSGC